MKELVNIFAKIDPCKEKKGIIRKEVRQLTCPKHTHKKEQEIMFVCMSVGSESKQRGLKMDLIKINTKIEANTHRIHNRDDLKYNYSA